MEMEFIEINMHKLNKMNFTDNIHAAELIRYALERISHYAH